MTGPHAWDHGECVTEATLTDYLEGDIDPALKAAGEVHLISCNKCRERLALLMRMMKPEHTPEEQDQIRAIAALWDGRRAHGALPLGARRSKRMWLLSLIGVAAAAMAVLGIWTRSEDEPGPQFSASEIADLLVAQVRPFEPRLAGQPHIPFKRTRGAEDTGPDYDVVAMGMKMQSADAYQMGRFYLVQRKFDRAIPELEQAAQQSNATAAVHNDLAVAYMEAGGELNLRKAAEQLRRSVEVDTGFLPAVFNMGILYERMSAGVVAAAQWNRYLELDSVSEWAKEARTKLDRKIY